MPVAHWLIKSEPNKWSWDMQVDAGAKGTFWNGVRNHTAKQNLMAMKKGEEAFFYHSNEGKEIVGIVKVIKTYYPDPSDATGKFGMCDFAAVKPLKKPVSLIEIKADTRLKDMMLVNNSRLSVQPVTEEEWALICELGGI
jgi:predicted RNA-binding protein with PUA-like domain